MPDGSYDISDINNYICFIMIMNAYNKDVNEVFDINLYANLIFNRVTGSVNSAFSQTLGSGLAKPFGSDFNQLPITNQEIFRLHRARVERVSNVVINCNLAENHYNFISNALYTFSPNKVFGVMLSIIPRYLVWTSYRNAGFKFIELWLTDEENRSLDIEDNVSMTLYIKDF